MEYKIHKIVDTAEVLLTRQIAKGGMSIVYEGCKRGFEGFEKKVAVKMLLTKWSKNEQFIRLFIAEANLLSHLVHENIVQIYQFEKIKDGPYYIIMEYVEGLSLNQFIRFHRAVGKAIPEALAVHLASRIARGLAYAHAFKDRTGQVLGIVHRDVCPQNIMITTEGLPKLIDFGVAKALLHSSLGDNWLTGKVQYMSPEQAACRAVDFRTDIYSLGVVLFEILAGVPIRSLDARPRKQEFADIPVPWEHLPRQTGEGLRDILKTMLHPDPAQRFQDTGEAARAMEYYIYKDGYGPTIQTMEKYLRTHFPFLYAHETQAATKKKRDRRTIATKDTVIDP